MTTSIDSPSLTARAASLEQQLESIYREMGTIGSVIGRKVDLGADDLSQVQMLSKWQVPLWDAHLILRDLLADRARLAQEPALVAYMQAETRGGRSAAFLRTYAERIRNGTAASWEIPNTVADTLEDIAKFIAASADDKHAFDNGSGMTEVMTVPEMIAEIQRLGQRCEELLKLASAYRQAHGRLAWDHEPDVDWTGDCDAAR